MKEPEPMGNHPKQGHYLFNNIAKVNTRALFPILAALFLELWNWKVAGRPGLFQLALFILLGCSMISAGRLFVHAFRIQTHPFDSPAFQFLAGFFLISTAAFLIKLISPLTICQSMVACSAVSIFANLVLRKHILTKDDRRLHHLDLLALLLSGIAATLWCWETMAPPLSIEGRTMFPLWSDCFEHMRNMSALSQATGWGYSVNIGMYGAPLHLYHYGSFVVPASFETIFKTHSYQMYVSLWLPFALLLSGLAAYALGSVLFGHWPGIAALFALLLIPDACFQGMGCKFLSYHFLQSIAPSGLYGISIITIAWMFLLHDCLKAESRLLLPALLFVMAAALFKAQIFIANLIPFGLYASLFWGAFGLRKRGIIIALFTVLFIGFFVASGCAPWMPTLKIDLKTIVEYSKTIAYSTTVPWVSTLVGHAGEKYDLPHLLLFLIANCAMSFGVWIILFGAAFFSLLRSSSFRLLAFPIVVIVSYLFFSEALDMNANHIYLPLELKHRPFVWAYFVVVVWTAAAWCNLLHGTWLSHQRLAVPIMGAAFLGSLFYPLNCRQGLQTMPAWGIKENAVPDALMTIADYIRNHSVSDETVQPSVRKDRYLLSAMSERPGYAIAVLDSMPAHFKERFQQLDGFRKMTNPDQIRDFIQHNPINWYVLYHPSSVLWPEIFKNTAVLQIGDYKLYHWNTSGHSQPRPPLGD